MKKQSIADLLIWVLLAASLLFLKGNKFDTGERFILTLAFGVLCFPILIGLLTPIIKKIKIDSILLGLFLIFLWLSFLFSETSNFGFSEVFVITGAVAVYIGIAAEPRTEHDRLLNWIVWLGVASALFGFVYFLTQFEPRMAGPFFDPFRRAHFFPNTFAGTFPSRRSFFTFRPTIFRTSTCKDGRCDFIFCGELYHG